MLRFDLTAYYSLLDVFDRTGRLMFPLDWTGEEAWSRDTENPDGIKTRREALIAEISSLHRDMIPLNEIMAMGLAADELQDTSDSLALIMRRLKEVKAELAQLPQITDTWLEDHAVFSRREAVEKELARAFTSGDLRLIVGTSRIVPWKSWCQRRDFRVYYSLSMIRIPKGESALRRGPAFVSKEMFEIWSNRFAQPEPDNEEHRLTAEAQLTEWLRELIARHPVKPQTTAALREQAIAMFPPLSTRGFNAVWKVTAPEAWRKKGRKKELE